MEAAIALQDTLKPEITTPLIDQPTEQTVGRIAVSVTCKSGQDCILGCDAAKDCIL